MTDEKGNYVWLHKNIENDHIKVVDAEDSPYMEFPKEDNGTVLIRTLRTQFEHAIGLKYKTEHGTWRAVREVDNAFVAPKDGGWGNRVYYLHFSESRKRKAVSDDADTSKVRDVAVCSLLYKTTEAEVKQYFERKYGTVEHVRIVISRETRTSRGFGFIRFKEEESARAALQGDNYIHGRKILVKEKKGKPMKLFVTGLPIGTTEVELNNYFSTWGEIIDSYIPQPFRYIGYFTISNSVDGQKCLSETDHFMGESRLKVKIRLDRNREDMGAPIGFHRFHRPPLPPGNMPPHMRGRGAPVHTPPGFRPPQGVRPPPGYCTPPDYCPPPGFRPPPFEERVEKAAHIIHMIDSLSKPR